MKMIEQQATRVIEVNEQNFENAANGGQIEILEWLLKKKEEERENNNGSSKLHFSGDIKLDKLLQVACIEGHLEMAKQLLEMGANVTTDGVFILLMVCSGKKENPEMVKLLLERGAYPEFNFLNNTELLRLAARSAFEETIKILLDHGILVLKQLL